MCGDFDNTVSITKELYKVTKCKNEGENKGIRVPEKPKTWLISNLGNSRGMRLNGLFYIRI